ncbi:DsbA family protein [Cellulomonas alba]|uniref:DsbA family protein n=1 Tax=Cellulomonas alba TaxID=3053467 RepID=A0ABT7SEV7_9CELL|nr:DsbA family protein [Cellulomonas alba]MDM7854102.1 DsbA family protein [Cellulomonas alba]
MDLPKDPALRHVYGDLAAPVTVVEFGDLECPHCRASAPVLRELVDTSDGLVRLVWRHFPLFEVHPHALTAALAAEAAGTVGLFWAMHDLLLARQDRLTDPDLRAYARELGIDPSLVTGDAAQVHAPAVEADYVAALGIGARATPTVLVGERRFEGEADLASLRGAVAEAASAAGLAVPDAWSATADPGVRTGRFGRPRFRSAPQEIVLTERPSTDLPVDACLPTRTTADTPSRTEPA